MQVGMCPFSCGHKETNMHYMEYQHKGIVDKCNKAIENLEKRMEKSGVCNIVKRLITQGIKCTKSTPGPYYILVTNGNFSRLIEEAYNEQLCIGWNNIWQGFISAKWSKAQHKYNRQNKFPPKAWSKMLVKWVVELSWDTWALRNTVLHGENIKEAREKWLTTLRQLTDILYDRAARLRVLNDHNIQQMFKLDRDKRKRKGV